MGNVDFEQGFKETYNKEVSQYKFDMNKFKKLPSPERFKQVIIDVIDFIDNNDQYIAVCKEIGAICTDYSIYSDFYGRYTKDTYNNNFKNLKLKSLNDYIEFITKALCDEKLISNEYDNIVKMIAKVTIDKNDAHALLPEIKEYVESLKQSKQQAQAQANAAAAMNINNMVPGYMNFVQQHQPLPQQPQIQPYPMIQQPCNCGVMHPYGTTCVAPFSMPYNVEDNFSKLSKHVSIASNISYADTTFLLNLFNKQGLDVELAKSGYDGKPMDVLGVKTGAYYKLRAGSTMEDVTEIIVEYDCVNDRVNINTTRKNK